MSLLNCNQIAFPVGALGVVNLVLDMSTKSVYVPAIDENEIVAAALPRVVVASGTYVDPAANLITSLS